LKFISSKSAIKFDLRSLKEERFSKYIDKEIYVGIRPEDFKLNFESLEKFEGNSFEANVEVIEPMGNETFIYFQIDDIQAVMRTDSSFDSKSKDKLKISFDISRVYFFDKESEIRI
ncbi:MAG: TOBE domain-containing protein, partial [Ignavibacteria bacterium]|nr:TOBE domain-containing protein [Ignavibacteria bacterium]